MSVGSRTHVCVCVCICQNLWGNILMMHEFQIDFFSLPLILSTFFFKFQPNPKGDRAHTHTHTRTDRVSIRFAICGTWEEIYENAMNVLPLSRCTKTTDTNYNSNTVIDDGINECPWQTNKQTNLIRIKSNIHARLCVGTWTEMDVWMDKIDTSASLAPRPRSVSPALAFHSF